ncbi:Permease of the major facilitator superfamily [Chitinispirillum alkaliphilum]|nr:Permease of the major facilitator superfamily [Chitinispirillum alkaliphilum]
MVVSAGIGLVIIGLMFFMEGLFLGIMPLGELLGVKLPRKSPLVYVLIFSFVLGLGATLAEPAIGILRAAGAAVKPWDAPLLFFILNRHPDYLVYAVGVGVGLAVVSGMLRFYYHLSIKPFVTILTGILVIFAIWSNFNPNLLYMIGIAWDSGGATTGPVTVPLVLALGIGICRVFGGAGLGASGFGVVALASLFPVITVQLVGLPFLNRVPEPMSAESFVSEENRSAVLQLFDSEEMFEQYLKRNHPELLRLYCDDGDDHRKESQDTHELLVSGSDSGLEDRGSGDSSIKTAEVISRSVGLAIRAIIPLVLFLLVVLMLFLRERLPRSDIVFTGIIFSLIGMVFFNIGMELGLAQLGNQVGRFLPATFKSITLPEEQIVIDDFDTELVHVALTPESQRQEFFYLKRGESVEVLPFNQESYDPETNRYLHTPVRGPLTGQKAGFFILLVFAFIMGYGATYAEPALNALGITVEEITIGTFRRAVLVNAVASGVGIGLVFGVIRIIWDIPLMYLLVPPYVAVLILTWVSSEDYAAVGWDCGGVTTGPITVPLVLAMGLGIGGQLGAVEGFGILALASVWPILIVLLLGSVLNRRTKAFTKKMANESEGIQ